MKFLKITLNKGYLFLFVVIFLNLSNIFLINMLGGYLMDNQLLPNLDNLNNLNKLDKDTIDLENFLNLAKYIKNLNRPANEEKDTALKESHFTAFSNNNINKIKSIIPFLDLKYRENLNSFINIILFNDIWAEYNTLKKENIEKTELKKQAISAIKQHMQNNTHLMDLIIKLLEINEIKNKINLKGVNNFDRF